MSQESLFELPFLGRLEIMEVYVYYDEPRLFSCKNQTGQIFLAVWIGESDEYETYYYVPLSRKRFEFIRSGGIDLYDAFKLSEDGFVYEIAVPFSEKEPTVSCLQVEDLEDENLPVPGKTIEYETRTLDLPPEWSLEKEAIATWRESIVLSLDVPEMKRNEAPASLLGAMLSSVQEVIYAFAQSFTGKKATKLATNTLHTNNLLVTGLIPGSFGVLLKSSVSGDLFGKTEVSKAISEFVSLLKAGANEEALKEHLLNLRGSSPQKFKQLLSQISHNKITFSFAWASPDKESGGAAEIDHVVAEETLNIANKIEQQKVVEHKVLGELVGINKRTKTFEIFDPVKEVRYSGKIAEPALPAFRDIRIKEKWQYEAVINEVREYETTGEIKPSKFYLLELKTPEEYETKEDQKTNLDELS